MLDVNEDCADAEEVPLNQLFSALFPQEQLDEIESMNISANVLLIKASSSYCMYLILY